MTEDHKKRYDNEFSKPAPERDLSHQVETRPCLSCRKQFRSEGHHNRICRDCKDRVDWGFGNDNYSVGYNKK